SLTIAGSTRSSDRPLPVRNSLSEAAFWAATAGPVQADNVNRSARHSNMLGSPPSRPDRHADPRLNGGAAQLSDRIPTGGDNSPQTGASRRQSARSGGTGGQGVGCPADTGVGLSARGR